MKANTAAAVAAAEKKQMPKGYSGAPTEVALEATEDLISIMHWHSVLTTFGPS